jgi:hypothetical protein
MSDDIKQKKEDLLRQLLKDKPDIGMKEANAVIRDQFDTGVSPPVFSKIRKALLEESVEAAKTKAPAKTAKAKVSAKKTGKVAEANKAEETQAEAIDADVKTEEKAKPKKAGRPKGKKAKGQAEASAKDDSAKDGATAEDAPKADSKQKAESKQNEEPKQKADVPAPEPEAPAEPEIDPNLPKFTVKIEVAIDIDAQEVHLCGGFNLWKVGELAMQKTEDNIWVFEGELPQGEYTYKFVVDQKIWYVDFSRRRVTDKTGVSHAITIGEPESAAS